MRNITLEFDSAGGSKSIDFVITGDCGGSIDDMTYSENLSWASITSAKTNSDTIRLTITCSGSTTTKLTGSITVSINGDSCSPIQCIQDAPGCTPTSVTCYSVSEATANVDSDATMAEVKWFYTATTVTTNEDCSETTTTQNGEETKQVGPFAVATCDETTNVKYGNFTWDNHKACDSNSNVTVNWTVYQAKPDGCDCNCDSISLSKSSMTWTPDNINHQQVVITFGNCIKIGEITITGQDSDHFVIDNQTVEDNKITLDVHPNETGLQDTKTATLNIPYGTGGTSTSNCTAKEITLTHDGAGCTCQNGFIGATVKQTTVSYGSTSTIWLIEHNCGSVRATSNGCNSSVSVGTDTTTVDGKTYTIVTATTQEIEKEETCGIGYVFQTRGTDCTDQTGMTSVTIENSCVLCGDFNEYDLVESIPSNGLDAEELIVKFSHSIDACANWSGEIYESDDQGNKKSGGYSDELNIITIDSINEYVKLRSAIPSNSDEHVKYYTYKIYNGECKEQCNESSYRVITQDEYIACECDVTMNQDPCSWPAGQTDYKLREYTISDCITIGDIYEVPEHETDMGHFNADKFEDGSETYIRIWPDIANTRVDEYNSTLHVEFLKNGEKCEEKEISLIHSGITCECDVLSFNKSQYAWGADEFGESARTIISYTVENENCMVGYPTISKSGDETKFFVSVDTSNRNVTVYPKEENTDEDNNVEMSITYSYYLRNYSDNPCTKEIKLTQYKAACSCTKIFNNACMLKKIPTTGGEICIGSGETHSCGTFEIIPGTTTNINSLRVDNTSTPGISKFYVDFKSVSSSEGEINSDFDINFIFNEENAEDEDRKKCPSKPLTIVQTPNYLTCNRLEEMFAYYNDSSLIVHSKEEKTYKVLSLYGTYKTTFDLFYSNDLLSFNMEEGSDWLTYMGIDEQSSPGWMYIVVKASKPSGNECQLRTAKLSISLNKEKARDFGMCDCGENSEKLFTIKEIPSSCNEQETRSIGPLSSEAKSGAVNLGPVCPSCVNRVEVICNGVTIDGRPYESEYTPLPGEYSWFQVCPSVWISQESDKDGLVYLSYKTNANTSTQDRVAVFNFCRYFIDGSSCCTEFTVTQSKYQDIICENVYAQSNSAINGPFYNVRSATCSPNSDMLTNALNYEGGEILMASYTRSNQYSIDNVGLSGVVASDNTEWVHFIPNSNPNNAVSFRYEVSSNTTPIREISKDYDGSTSGRCAELTLLLIGSDGLPIKDVNGDECPGLTFPVYQKGFGGYCPTCNSIVRIEGDNYINVKYEDYGESQIHYDEDDPQSPLVPAFHGNEEINLNLFECEFNIEETSYDGVKIRCFDLIVESSNENIVEGSLYAEYDNNNDKYIIHGKLKENTTGSNLTISVMLYLGKRDFLSENGKSMKCDNTLTMGYFKLLAN